MSTEPSLLVIDASVAVKWYLPEVHSEEALALLNPGFELLAPDLIHVQLGALLSKRVKEGVLPLDIAVLAAANFLRQPVRIVPTHELLVDALEVAAATPRTFSDSVYFALAIRERARIVTADHRWFTLLSTGSMREHLMWVGSAHRLLTGARVL